MHLAVRFSHCFPSAVVFPFCLWHDFWYALTLRIQGLLRNKYPIALAVCNDEPLRVSAPNQSVFTVSLRVCLIHVGAVFERIAISVPEHNRICVPQQRS